MADEDLLDRVGGLSDLELAFLLCLVNREHCIVSTQPESLDDLVEELQLISAKTFGLSPLAIACTPHTTLDDLAASIVHPPPHSSPAAPGSAAALHQASPSARSPSPLRARLLHGDSYIPAVTPLTPFASPPAASSPRFGGRSGSFGGGGGGFGLGVGLGSSSTAGIGGGHGVYGGPGAAAGGNRVGQIANVILARDLDKAPGAVQIQVLELLRTRRIFTRTTVQTVPKTFLFIAVLGDRPHDSAAADDAAAAATPVSRGHSRTRSIGAATTATNATAAAAAAVLAAPVPAGGATVTGLTTHLNDYFFVAHRHDAEADGFANLDDEWRQGHAGGNDDTASTESVLRKSVVGEPSVLADGLFSEDDIACLANLGREVHVDVDVLRYQMNIVSFLRMHRAVAGGICPVATAHFDRLMRSLAPLNRIDYVTPALVALAARKIYLHRIRVVTPEKERSMQWGSSLDAIKRLLDGVGPEDIIEDVLGMVAAPP